MCHNSAGENLSDILQDAVRLNTYTLEIAKIIYHLIVEEYDGETLSLEEEITKVVKKDDLK